MSAAFLICMLFPNGQDLRPVITQTDPFSLLIRMIYSTDTPTNVFPSVHVINSLAVDAALQHTDKAASRRYLKIFSRILTLLICMSTIFIKQHSIADLVGGIFLGSLIYMVLYKLPAREIQSAFKKRSYRKKQACKGISSEKQLSGEQ